MARVGRVAYHFDLPKELSYIHNTFLVSQLRKCVTKESLVVRLDDIYVDFRLNYIERWAVILDTKKKTLRNVMLPLVKV